MKLLLALYISSACFPLFSEDKPTPKPSEPRLTEVESLRLRNFALELQVLEAKYAELIKQRSEAVAAICKRTGAEGCEIRPDGVIAKRDAKAEVKQ